VLPIVWLKDRLPQMTLGPTTDEIRDFGLAIPAAGRPVFGPSLRTEIRYPAIHSWRTLNRAPLHGPPASRIAPGQDQAAARPDQSVRRVSLLHHHANREGMRPE
jgi:hypothetical protein